MLMVVTGAHAVKLLCQTQEKYTDRDQPLSSFIPVVSLNITDSAFEARAAMEAAIRDIILMTFTNEDSDVVSYEAQFKAGQRPNRRLMQEIYVVREELLMVEKIADEQRQTLKNYRRVLNPSTFRITTQSRISSFELEERRLGTILDRINDDINLIKILLDRLESIATQTRNGVEVRQEDQSKAIMIFTIMTVVFMPLSFVTGYFGMNTNDIRNMESSQTLFWTVSIPFTVVIIAAVLLVAFQADRLREALDNLLWHDDVPVGMPINNPWAEKEMPEEDKKYLETARSAVSPGKQWLPRRRAKNRKVAPQDSSFV
ncbi:Mg2+ transporter protein CorA-like/Zinc transport protein ZntB [Penicillium longicatenatum]|uniref:Mg2+ transporter protein CorA-like/Zinc transport protein ZntB n=1 Tax=Penicillium longicatenatum TaxID=1561947 RepID=UPI00254987D2|nr:Mg2+ transporter protein CorA-like/Zinc transport protein ZntB [Penicillium longicatenatum]KAJ5630873.1 Mg2+ transporter protein CorA-like/Zinc transport protein ZntB [Penicillium longicatenatum]